MTIQTSMALHKLEVLKGDRNSIVDDTSILDPAQSVATGVVAGRCMTHTAGGKLQAGLVTGKLPFFAWSGLDPNNFPDVQRDRGMPYSGASRFGTISGMASCELSTTEIVGSTFAPGDALTALSATPTVPADAGKLKLANGTTDVIVGWVSPRGYYVGPDGYPTLAFYPSFVKGTTVPVA